MRRKKEWKELTSPRSFRESTSTALWREWQPRMAEKCSHAAAQKAEKDWLIDLDVRIQKKVRRNQKQPRFQLFVQKGRIHCDIRLCMLYKAAPSGEKPSRHRHGEKGRKRGQKKSCKTDYTRSISGNRPRNQRKRDGKIWFRFRGAVKDAVAKNRADFEPDEEERFAENFARIICKNNLQNKVKWNIFYWD